jgi:hypothetical protein
MPMGEVITNVFAGLAALAFTGAGAAGVAYWIFRTLGKGWLDAHFAKDLEATKAANVRESERLKADLGRYADRASKFHAREYEVLPEAWGLMNRAFGACHSAIASFQQYADLDKMTGPQLEAWFEGSGLETYQKDEIRAAGRKNDKLVGFLTWKQIGDAERAVAEFQNYVIIQGVFIDEDLAEKMAEAGRQMRRALINRSMVERTKGFSSPGQTDFWQESNNELEPVGKWVQEVKETIRMRLSDIKGPAAPELPQTRAAGLAADRPKIL